LFQFFSPIDGPEKVDAWDATSLPQSPPVTFS
jgi:hypothetical protein